MAQNEAFATKLPVDLKQALDEVCEKLGMKKSFIVESALREKLEDLLDTYDLQEATKEAGGFHYWETIRKDLQKPPSPK